MLKRTLCVAVSLWPLLSGTSGVAGPLNPMDYAASGELLLTSGTAVLNTNGTPTLTANGVTYTGFVLNGVAIFDFNYINIGSGATLTATGSVPVALLSRSDVAIGGTIDASGGSGSAAGASAGGPGGGAGGASPSYQGGGPGGGSGAPASILIGGGGGGFGGAGAAGTAFHGNNGGSISPDAGGSAYGNLAITLQGGSGGGGGGGGAGGGGIEIGAVGQITFSQGGLIDADGGSSAGPNAAASGGGSGGGIFLHAATFAFNSTATELSAAGGAGGPGEFIGGPGGGSGAAGGAGGGGRILLESTSGMNGNPLYNLAGGGQGAGMGSFQSVAVPEPSSLALLAIGTLGLYARSRGRRPR